MASRTTWTALLAGAGLLSLAAAAPSTALAGGTGGGCGCKPPPPPPPPPCCSPPPGHTVNVPGVNVFVAPSVVVTENVNAQATANTEAASQTIAGGGAGGGVSAPVTNGIIQGLDVGAERRSAFEAWRTIVKKVVIQAFCFDDKMTPHPASQVFPGRDVESGYEGELYRCIAGTHMQVTIANFRENISFAGGETLTCAKGEALWHSPGGPDGRGGQIACRPQKPARDCNERSLLRRFGAGIKVMTLVIRERYTAYREETTGAAASSMSLDGGVGGIAY